MAWFPGAVRKPVARYKHGGSSAVAMTTHRRVIFHTAVSNTDSLYGLFATPGNAVSHFYVREDGTVEQYIDTAIRSSANLEGNHDCITVETWDGYGASWHGGSPGPKWTEAQRRSLAEIAAWANKVHGVPLHRLRNSRPGTRGIGWHRQGIDGNFGSGILSGRVPGGERWSSSFGKVCPTDTRIKQVPGIIKLAAEPKGPRINRARVNRSLTHPDHRQGGAAKRQLGRLVKALRRHGYTVEGYPPHVESIRRAVKKWQENQGWTGRDADGLVGPTTARLLGLRSHWRKVKSWDRRDNLIRPFTK